MLQKIVSENILVHQFCSFLLDCYECHYITKICTWVENKGMFITIKIKMNSLPSLWILLFMVGAFELGNSVARDHVMWRTELSSEPFDKIDSHTS